jgi:hypothetical protein
MTKKSFSGREKDNKGSRFKGKVFHLNDSGHDATWGGGPTEAELERMKWRSKKEETILSSSENETSESGDSDEGEKTDEGNEENGSEASGSEESENESGEEVSVHHYSSIGHAGRVFHCFGVLYPSGIRMLTFRFPTDSFLYIP